MTLEEQRAAIEARMRAIHDTAGDSPLTDEQQAEWTAAETELRTTNEQITAREARRTQVAGFAQRPGHIEDGDGARSAGPQLLTRVEPFDGRPVAELTRSEARSKAMAAIEREDTILDSRKKDELDERLRRSLSKQNVNYDGDYIARRLLLTENEHYRSAFMKYTVFGPGAALTPEEARAVSAFQQYEMRAMNEGTSSAGGYGIPVYIDSSIILTSGAADAPILRVARIEQITVPTWKGVSSAGVTWSFGAEAVSASDISPTLAQPSVTAYMAKGYIPYSIEVGMDYPNFANEMERLIGSGYIDLLAVKTTVGSGSTQPRGIFTALDANTNVEVVVTTDGSFGAVDVFKVWNSLAERYRSRATWVMSVSVESAIRQFATNSNSSAYFTVDLTADGISKINGRPVIVTDYAPSYSGSVPGTTGAANICAVGDFSNYLIAQRAGMSIENIPMLFDVTSNAPTGQRAWFAWARVGADSINDVGFRLLQNQ